jgi:hypothetical protein
MAGAPEGNTNSKAENRLWGNTIRRAAAQDPEKLRRIAEKLLADAEAGDIQAIKELGDRLDGKAMQSIEAQVSGNLAMILGSIGKNDPPLEG